MRALANRTCIAVLLIVGWTTMSPVAAQAPQDGLQLPDGPSGTGALHNRPASVPQETGTRSSIGESSITAPAVSIGAAQLQSDRAGSGNNSFEANVPSRTEVSVPHGDQPEESPNGNQSNRGVEGANESPRPTAPDREPLKLSPPSSSQASNGKGAARNWVKPQVTTTFLSLLVVLSTFFVLAWFVKRSKPSSSAALPSEAIEVLGKTTYNGKQQLQVVRFGNKLILLSVSQTTATSIGEITDPSEVERITQLCSSNQSGSISDTFRQVLTQLGTERTNTGFLADRPVNVDSGDEEPEREVATGRKRRWF